MTIESEKTRALLKQCRFHYGCVYDSDLQSDPDDIIAIDLWTDPLPIVLTPESTEYSLASQIAQKYNIILFQQDFSKRGQRSIYKPVFGITCKNIIEIEEGLQDLDLAERELKDRLKILANLAMEK